MLALNNTKVKVKQQDFVFFFLVDHVDDSSSEQSSEEEERAQQPLEQLDMREHCAGLFDKAAVHLRRAMVLSTRTNKEPCTHISGVPVQIYNVQNIRFPTFTKQMRNALKQEGIFVSVCIEFC